MIGRDLDVQVKLPSPSPTPNPVGPSLSVLCPCLQPFCVHLLGPWSKPRTSLTQLWHYIPDTTSINSAHTNRCPVSASIMHSTMALLLNVWIYAIFLVKEITNPSYKQAEHHNHHLESTPSHPTHHKQSAGFPAHFFFSPRHVYIVLVHEKNLVSSVPLLLPFSITWASFKLLHSLQRSSLNCCVTLHQGNVFNLLKHASPKGHAKLPHFGLL